MNQEDKDQIVSRLRRLAEIESKFREDNKDWTNPSTETVSIAKEHTFKSLADMFENLRAE